MQVTSPPATSVSSATDIDMRLLLYSIGSSVLPLAEAPVPTEGRRKRRPFQSRVLVWRLYPPPQEIDQWGEHTTANVAYASYGAWDPGHRAFRFSRKARPPSLLSAEALVFVRTEPMI